MIDEIWRLGVYDRLLKFVNPGSNVIDIGANIGVFSIKAGKFKNEVKVFSFEPFPKNFSGLKENIKLNRLENVIHDVR